MKKNPSAEDVLQSRSESWENVRWDSLEFDEEDAAEMPYTFSVKVPCWVPEDTEEKIAERRIESAVRHFLARAVTLPTGQRTLPGVKLRPAGVPGVGIHVDLDGYTEVDVTMAFDPDVSGQTLRTIVSLLDAVDANPGALCPFPPEPPEDEDDDAHLVSPRRQPNPGVSNAALVQRLKF